MALVQILIAIALFFALQVGGHQHVDGPDCGTDNTDGCVVTDQPCED